MCKFLPKDIFSLLAIDIYSIFLLCINSLLICKSQIFLQTWNQYLVQHKQKFPNVSTVDNTTDPAEDESAFMFDAMWTAALALNRTATRLNEDNLNLTDFNYDDEHDISSIIYEEALQVKFFGLTVSHYYTQHM